MSFRFVAGCPGGHVTMVRRRHGPTRGVWRFTKNRNAGDLSNFSGAAKRMLQNWPTAPDAAVKKPHLTLIGNALCAAAIVLSGSVEALTIDQFDEGGEVRLQVGDPLPSPLPPWPTEDGRVVNNALGGGRKMTLTNVTGTAGSTRAMATVLNGTQPGLRVSNDSGVNSTVTVVWDGNQDLSQPANVSINGLGGVDLLADGSNAFLLTVPSIDQNVHVQLTVWSNGASAQVSQTFDRTTPSYEIPFSGFAGIDFRTIGAIRMILTGPVEWDGTVALVGTTTVPLPPTWALAGVGLALLARARTRRRTNEGLNR